MMGSSFYHQDSRHCQLQPTDDSSSPLSPGTRLLLPHHDVSSRIDQAFQNVPPVSSFASTPQPRPIPHQQQTVEPEHKATSKSITRTHLPPSEVPCKFFNRGFCNRGASCWFKHDVNFFLQLSSDPSSQGEVASTSTEANQTPGKPGSSCLSDSSKTEGKLSTEICSICFEVPELYGILESCDHVFCLDCIRSWRSSSTLHPHTRPVDSNKVSKTCPCCRIPSRYIISSSVFPTPSDRPDQQGSSSITKKSIVTNYLAQMKRIPCRYFQDSIQKNVDKPTCPFANECHYGHASPLTGDDYLFSESELRGIRRRASRARQLRSGREQEILQALFLHELPEAVTHFPISYDIDAIFGWLSNESFEELQNGEDALHQSDETN